MRDRFVVTGASGFIGRRLCEALRERGRVTAVLRSGPAAGPWDDVVVADLARESLPAGALEGAGVVFHFAGRAHAVAERASDLELYRRVNVEGTRRVLEAALASGVRRVVFASSVKAMGEEGDTGGALSPYGLSKRDAEQLVRESGVPETVVLRLALVYGPGVEGNLGHMLRAVRAGRFPPPPPVPNRRAMVHVDDVVRVAVRAADHPAAAGRTFVVGDGVAYSTRGIYDAMRRALGMTPASWSLPVPLWRALALAGDAVGALARRRAPFDSEACRKLFACAWYEPSDLRSTLGVPSFSTLEDALRDMVRER
jgi:nucleoside-diphosphate-sugar epimerase